MLHVNSWVVLGLGVLVSWVAADYQAAERPAPKNEDVGKLTFVKTIKGPQLSSVNSLAASADGKYLYTTAWASSTIVVYSQDTETGLLTEVQQMTSARDLDGCTGIALSRDGKFAVANAFRSQTIVLFERDPESGRLRYLDAAREGERGVEGLTWSIHCCYSRDGKFVYASDPRQAGRGAGDGMTGSLTAFRITDNLKLKWIEANRGERGSFVGTRGVPHLSKSTLRAMRGCGISRVRIKSRSAPTAVVLRQSLELVCHWLCQC